MTIKFIDRVEELNKLKEFFESKRVALIYGRRRIGKTRLILEFIKNKNFLYLLAVDKGYEYNLRKFSGEISKKYKVPGLRFKNYKEMFEFLNETKTEIIAIDEFGYIIEAIPESQEILDSNLNKKIILTGSTVSLIESRLLNYRNPVYGRIDFYLKLKPLKVDNLLEWFKNKPIGELIKLYGAVGGVPKYLEFFSAKKVEEEIKNNFFNDTTFIFRDAKLLLEEELREPSRYIIILEAIANGKNSITKISGYSKIESKDIPFYLKVLRNLGIVSVEKPLFHKKGVRYIISDNYFNFWFRFISPYEDEIESSFLDNVTNDFKKNFNSYLGFIFEKICKEFLIKNREKLSFRFTKIGRWWGFYRDKENKRKELEIDLVALNEEEKKILFVECKWKNLKEKEVREILEELKDKSKFVDWNLNDRKEYFGLIGKKIENKSRLRKEGFLAFDLSDF